MNKIEKIKQLFLEKPYLVRMGANSIARIHNLDPQDVRTARNELKKAKLLQQREAPKKEVKILLFDIETSPLKVYVWRRWMQNVYLD